MAEPIRVLNMTTTEPAPAEAISADELAYHRIAAFDLRVAQGVWGSWTGHLIRKYRIGPFDRLNEDGTIERGVVPPNAG